MNESFSKILFSVKIKELYTIKNPTCLLSASLSLITFIILNLIKAPLNELCEQCCSFLENIGLAYIGFLGFIITGLAMLIGTITNKLYSKLKDSDKLKNVQNILCSFVLLGFLSAIIIISSFIMHLVSDIPVDVNPICFFVICIILSYLIYFTIIYSTILIGNCIDLFFILNEIEGSEPNVQNRYTRYRVIALERLSIKNLDNINDYQNSIKELIENDSETSNNEKELLSQLYNNQFKHCK